MRKRPIRRTCPMAPRRTFSLSLPPFTKAVKWLILVNAGVYLLVTLLQAFAPGLGDVIGYVLSLVPRQIVFHGWIWQLQLIPSCMSGFFTFSST